MATLTDNLKGCPAPAGVPAEMVAHYSHRAHGYGYEDVKNEAAAAKRTATQLTEVSGQFAKLTTADQRSWCTPVRQWCAWETLARA